MKINIINSGSDGNCTVLTDRAGNQILLDCGLPYEVIVPNINMAKLNFILISHLHGDHIYGLPNFEKYFFDVYSPNNVTDNKEIDTLCWKVIPIKLVHNIECFGFLIFNKLENKKILYMTDTQYLAKVGDVDCCIFDCNYDEDIVLDCLARDEKINMGHKNHSSTQSNVEWLKEHNGRIKTFVAFHISNSGLQNVDKVVHSLTPLVDNLIIAKPHTIFEI